MRTAATNTAPQQEGTQMIIEFVAELIDFGTILILI